MWVVAYITTNNIFNVSLIVGEVCYTSGLNEQYIDESFSIELLLNENLAIQNRKSIRSNTCF